MKQEVMLNDNYKVVMRSTKNGRIDIRLYSKHDNMWYPSNQGFRMDFPEYKKFIDLCAQLYAEENKRPRTTGIKPDG
jgi:hypothetical protein